MIVLTLGQIFKGKDALNKLVNLPLPAKKAYTVTKFLREIKKEFDTIESVRVNLVKQFGEDDGSGNISITDSKKLEEFNSQFSELLSETREYNFDKFSIEDFGNAEFTPSEMSVLFDIIFE